MSRRGEVMIHHELAYNDTRGGDWPFTTASIITKPSSTAALPAGLVKLILAVSEVVPAVPTQISKVEVADPAAVLVRLNFHENLLPSSNPESGTEIAEPAM